MPSGTATRPGDIVRAMNGKHIEVDNTDAEGRLVLADALCYAVAEGATHIIDSATLTGAFTYAPGSTRVAVMANDDALAGRVMAAGDAAGERYWQCPLYTSEAAAHMQCGDSCGCRIINKKKNQ